MLAEFGRPSHATVVAYASLFIALGGSSYAAITLSENSVTSTTIKNGQVKNPDLANNAVTGAKVKDGSLLSADFKPGELPDQATGLWAIGRADGTLGPHSSHVTGVTGGIAGIYEVTFDQDVSGCAFLGTPTETEPGSSYSSHQVVTSRPRSDSTNTVLVTAYSYDGRGTKQGDYALAVFC